MRGEPWEHLLRHVGRRLGLLCGDCGVHGRSSQPKRRVSARKGAGRGGAGGVRGRPHRDAGGEARHDDGEARGALLLRPVGELVRHLAAGDEGEHEVLLADGERRGRVERLGAGATEDGRSWAEKDMRGKRLRGALGRRGRRIGGRGATG